MVRGLDAFKRHFDSRDIGKHKNDIARLATLTAGLEPDAPEGIRAVMAEFMKKYQSESLDVAALRLPLSEREVKSEIRRLFKL